MLDAQGLAGKNLNHIHGDIDGLKAGRKRGLHQLSKENRFHPPQNTYCRYMKLHAFIPSK
jgi:hypothetical protein